VREKAQAGRTAKIIGQCRGEVRAENREEKPKKKRSNSPERQNGRTAERQNGRTAERQNGRTAEIGRYGRKMKIICNKKVILKGRDDKHEMRIFWR
jgi:hypothetical protein